MPTYRAALPQLSDRIFLTDGGIETTLIYRRRASSCPDFAAFVLLDDDAGRAALRRYFEPYLDVARDAGLRHRAGDPDLAGQPRLGRPGWATRRAALAEANRAAVELLAELRDEHATARTPVVLSGCIGPRGDGYQPGVADDPARGAGLPRRADRRPSRDTDGRPGHRDHHDPHRRGDRHRAGRRRSGPAQCRLVHRRDRRPAAVGEPLGEAIDAGRRGDRRRPRPTTWSTAPTRPTWTTTLIAGAGLDRPGSAGCAPTPRR